MLITEFINFTNILLKIVGYPKFKKFYKLKKLLSYFVYKYYVLRCKYLVVNKAPMRNLLFQFSFLNLYLIESVGDTDIYATDTYNLKVFGDDSPITLFITLKTPGKIIAINTIDMKSKYEDDEIILSVKDRNDLISVTVNQKDYATTFSYSENMIDANRKDAVADIERLFRSAVNMFVQNRFEAMYRDLNEAYK